MRGTLSSTYSTRSAAKAGAKRWCRARLGQQYEPYEGPDFYVESFFPFGSCERRWRFKLSPSFIAILEEHQPELG